MRGAAALRLLITVAVMLEFCASAQNSNIARPEFWATDAPVRCIIETNGTVYIGGDFHYVGYFGGGGWTVSLSSGVTAATLPKIDGRVLCAVDDLSGGWFVGGEFTHIGTNACSYIAHLLPDGSPDRAWTFGADDAVNALLLSSNTLYAAGSFTQIGGAAHNRLAALNIADGSAKSWSPSLGVTAYCIALGTNNDIYVGGAFTNVNSSI
ncbi:MAG: hypothetical protein JWO95_3080, partial [Verrucomicrobiales bacterium]|nr:hypothetical protein [Verrucomicrobiales bacterium]